MVDFPVSFMKNELIVAPGIREETRHVQDIRRKPQGWEIHKNISSSIVFACSSTPYHGCFKPPIPSARRILIAGS